jgi:hypothetical protein
VKSEKSRAGARRRIASLQRELRAAKERLRVALDNERQVVRREELAEDEIRLELATLKRETLDALYRAGDIEQRRQAAITRLIAVDGIRYLHEIALLPSLPSDLRSTVDGMRGELERLARLYRLRFRKLPAPVPHLSDDEE